MSRFDALVEAYGLATGASRELQSRAELVHPAGDTRSVLSVRPYPPYLRERRGYEVTDVDGNVLIDCINNFTSLIHGGAVTSHDAIREQMERGLAFAGPTAPAIELAELLAARVPSLERLRFCNSGTEAVMHAIRAARAYTGRDRILRFAHGYHGSYDVTAISTSPAEEGPEALRSHLSGTGVPPATFAGSLIAPYNSLAAATALVRAHGDELAAILVEPMQNAAGSISGEHAFLRGLAELASSSGALLIFDEVVTLRLAPGGLQGESGIRPDLTALGKIIGGGLPIGVFGGRADVMEVFAPGRGRAVQSGTFNAHPLSMAAGLAAMRSYDEAEVSRLNALGARLGLHLTEICGREATVSGFGSLWTVSWPEAEGGEGNGLDRQTAFYLACFLSGLHIASRGLFALSTPMDEAVVDEIATRTAAAVGLMTSQANV